VPGNATAASSRRSGSRLRRYSSSPARGTSPSCAGPSGAGPSCTGPEPAVALGDRHRLGAGARPVLPMAADKWLRTVPSDRYSRAAMVAAEEPSRAARSTSVSRGVGGDSPLTRLSGASAGSTTRSPACTRRTASASWRAGVSFTTNPAAPAWMARRRYPSGQTSAIAAGRAARWGRAGR